MEKLGRPGLRIISVEHALAQAAVCDRVADACRERGIPAVRIAVDADAAVRTLRRRADAGEPSLGTPCTAFEHWALGRWELYGDGRAPVSAAERHAAAMAALDQVAHEWPAAKLPGMVGCVEGVVRAASGAPAFEGADEGEANGEDTGGKDRAGARLTPAERRLLDTCRIYGRLLEERGLIEPGTAESLLPQAMGMSGWSHLILDGLRALTDAEVGLLAQAALHRGVILVAPLGDHPACEAARNIAERLASAAERTGVPVERFADAEPWLAGNPAADPRAPWSSAEVANLAMAVFRAGRVPVLEPRGDVQFCLPSGRYAEPELIARTLQRLVADGVTARDIAVACSDPLSQAEAVSNRLAETPGRAIPCRAQGSVDVGATSIGRLTNALVTLVEAERLHGTAPDPGLRGAASDAARNPLSGIAVEDALDLDCAWRGDRTTGAARILADLTRAASGTPGAAASDGSEPGAPAGAADTAGAMRAASGSTPSLIRAIDALRKDELASAVEALCEPLSGSGVTERLERQAGAVIARRARAERSLRPGQPLTSTGLARLLAGARAASSWVSVAATDVAAQAAASVLDANPNAIEFCTLAQLEGRSFEAIVICDLTADDAPVGDRLDAQNMVLSHLGVALPPPALQTMRRRLRAGLEAARSRIVFERCLQDPEARTLRPSALFEEVVDCYRADPTSADDLDRTTGLPKGDLLPMAGLGEERFAELACPATWTPAAAMLPVSSPLLRPDIARRQFFGDDKVWSPAGLEQYLTCPQRWYYEQQLSSSRVDASFGSRELGAFSRRVLRVFHEKMAQRGKPRVAGASDLQEWGPVLDESFEQVRSEPRIGPNPLVPVDSLELERLETVRRDLQARIEQDARLMPAGFAPRDHDWSYGEREPLVFGSIRLRGSVDRVDADLSGHALIIDYQGAFGEGYRLPSKRQRHKLAQQSTGDGTLLPQHFRALVNAAALQRVRPGTTVVGALYASYNRTRIMGFLDRAATCLKAGPAQDGGAEFEEFLERNAVEPTDEGGNGFQELLDNVEREVASAMDRLRDGDVGPRPRFGKQSCTYCTVPRCPRRNGA